MVKINTHYQKLSKDYLFAEIDKKVSTLQEDLIINLAVGDISHPLFPFIVDAICTATREMGETVKGYGPSNGYLFLRKAIVENDYKDCNISPDEIFISNGSKNDMANIQEIFAISNKVAVCDPTYPVYVDSNVIAGRYKQRKKDGRYGGIIYLSCLEKNNFLPSLPKQKCDLIYLCSPNNPTGQAFSKKELEKWVKFAKKMDAVILFDGAYEAFITSKDSPHSIYEIGQADEVAIEFRSFSKKVGFTNLRLSYITIPKRIKKLYKNKEISLHALWKRRTDAKFNGVPYPIQKGAYATYTPKGKEEINKMIKNYLYNAKILRETLTALGYKVYGGIDSPYIWLKAPSKMSSMEFFDLLLKKSHIITAPGSSFGRCGKGFVRISCMTTTDQIEKAALYLKKL